MADPLNAVSCANGWVYVYWDIPGNVKEYRVFRTDVTAGTPEQRIHKTTSVNSLRSGWMTVSPGTPGATVRASSPFGRFVGKKLDTKYSHYFRLLRRGATAASKPREVKAKQNRIVVNPGMDGILVCWQPQYAGAARELYLETSSSFSGTHADWTLLETFKENDAKNVRLPSKRFGYYVDRAAGKSPLSDGHKLKYRVQYRVGGTWTDWTAELQHDWRKGDKLAFFLDDKDFRQDFIYYDGAKVVAYFEHLALIKAKYTTYVAVGTRYDHAKAGGKCYWYGANSADKWQMDIIIPKAEGADGIIQKVEDNFGGHVPTSGATATEAKLLAFFVPQDGTLGYAWGTMDGHADPLTRNDGVGNRRHLVYVTPYAGTMFDKVQHTEKMLGTFAHEYMHLNYHKALVDRSKTGKSHMWTTDSTNDTSLNEGSGLYSENVVNHFSELFNKSRLEAQNSWNNLFLFYGWPSDASFRLYARGMAWVAYNANRHKDTAAMKGWTNAKVPRAWGPPGTPAPGFADYFREFHLAMVMNKHMPDDAPLALKGYTGPTPGSTADELAVSLKRKNGDGSYVLPAKILRDWEIKPHMYGTGAGSSEPLARLCRDANELAARKKTDWQSMTIRHASAYFAAFQPPADAFQGTLIVEMQTKKNKGRLRKVMATARRVGDGSGDPSWEYHSVDRHKTRTRMIFPDLGSRVDLVILSATLETLVPSSVGKYATVRSETIKWDYFVTLPTQVQAVGFLPDEAYRGGENVILVEPDKSPVSYVSPGKLRPWVLFNQDMDEGKKFHADVDGTEVVLDRDKYLTCAVGGDTWRGKTATLATADAALDGKEVALEIGRATLAGATINDGVRNFAGAYLDMRDDKIAGVAPEADKRWRAILDTKGPDVKSVKYTDAKGTTATMANGAKIVGVVKLEIEVEDKTSGVAAIEVVARHQKSRASYTAGRKVVAPDPATGKYPDSVKETFFWNTSAADNGPIDLEVLACDRVGNITRKTYVGTRIVNKKPGAKEESPNLEAPDGADPKLEIEKKEADGGTGSFKTFAAGDIVRGKLKFKLKGGALKGWGQFIVEAKSKTTKKPEEIWSDYIATNGDDSISHEWEVDSNALPDGEIELSFRIKDEKNKKSPAGPGKIKLKVANRPPSIIPLEPAVTTRGIIDLFGYVDDRCAPAIKPGKLQATWKVGKKTMKRTLESFPRGSFLQRAGMHPVHATKNGWAPGLGDLKLSSKGPDPESVPLMVLHDLGLHHPIPQRVVRMTIPSKGEPTTFYEITCAAEHSVLVEGATTKVKLRIIGEAPVKASDVAVTFEGEGALETDKDRKLIVTAPGDGEFTATIKSKDGKGAKGILKVEATDEVGNVGKFEYPIWVVKEPVKPENLTIEFELKDLPDAPGPATSKQVRLDGTASKPIYFPPMLDAAGVRLDDLGLSLKEVSLLFEDKDATEHQVSLKKKDSSPGPLERSKVRPGAWETATSAYVGGKEGAGKFVIKLVDQYGNETKQKIDGFHLDDYPTGEVKAGQSIKSGSATKLVLDPKPKDTRAVKKVRVVLSRSETVGSGSNKSTVSWDVYVDVPPGAGSVQLPPLMPGDYSGELKVIDETGNEGSGYTDKVTITP